MSDSYLKAAIWDMDGVIADTVLEHFLSWKDTFAKKGRDYTMAEFMTYFGRRNDVIIKDALGHDIAPGELEAINMEKQATFRRRITGHVRELPGAVELIRILHEHNIKQAIASSAPRENIKLILQELDIDDCFQAIVAGGEVPEGKPDPGIFLLAAKKLSIKPVNCVVFEDAIAGVAGAKSAGMKCVAVTNSHPENKLKQADIIVDTLNSVSYSDLELLFHKRYKQTSHRSI
jgi:HAD superfamily hydrolase (TIGR01509 family)